MGELVRWGIVSLAVIMSAGAAGQSADRPNIVWIWCDNLAYGDLGCYGNDAIETPRIDGLAAEGARFTQYYIAHTVCSPSRAALLTGRQPFRVGIVDVLLPDGPSGMPADEVTLGEALQEQGYATAAFGKWHLGDRQEFLPLQHGFDHYFGLPYSMDMLPTVLYRDNAIVERLDGDKVQDVTERLVDDAIAFMEARHDEPFFVYFNHTIPHPPINIPSDHVDSSHSLYENAVEYMDEQTGRLIDFIDDSGLGENTLVVFSSDNGPMGRHGDTGGLRGRIRDSYEGGIRVPLIARWPGRIPAGGEVDEAAFAYDIFPTLVKLAGGAVPDGRVYDGQDIWPLLAGADGFVRDKPVFWVYLDNVTAMRDGKWKLHVAHRSEALERPELYDVAADPGESKVLNGDHPDRLERMLGAIREFEADIPKVWRLQYPVRDPAKRPSGVRRE